ncbi:Gfo/Idh/MocA family oxidoreductase [Bacillus sp. USDA818B3_A]|uniref:Gfo/Idh/MocA family oxidoreductase n=1 Tax=Bacillus sp. USDA818B3_A TaxID=2698834 RepID=UPI00136D96E8|nr:Gfo/Idh/MocA family oxidoreductase [Bacillus sp. USDA818B3_A]
MPPIKIGVAGVGSMGVNHCKVLQMMKNADFIGVFDIEQKRSEKIASTFGVQSFSSFSKLIDTVDAVIIAVQTSHHFSLTMQAIQKVKHVLVEKPFVSSLKEAQQIIKAVDKGSVVVQVGHVERFNPAFKQLSELMNKGNVISLEARRFGVPNRNIETDVVLDLMIHDIDLVLKLVDSQISTVNAAGYFIGDGKQLEAASALISFQNGCFASLLSSRYSLDKKREINVTEKDRFLKANLLTKELYVYHNSKPSPTANCSYPVENIVEKIIIPHQETLYLEIEHFIQSIQSRQTPLVGVHDAYKVLEVAVKIKDQIEKK